MRSARLSSAAKAGCSATPSRALSPAPICTRSWKPARPTASSRTPTSPSSLNGCHTSRPSRTMRPCCRGMPEPLHDPHQIRPSRSRTWALERLPHLKVFQHVGRFLPVRDLPPAAIAHVAKQIYLDTPQEFGYDRRTLYRHHKAIREYLGITPWGAEARKIASKAIAAAAEARLDPADLINAAIDALVRERCELPLLTTIETMAGTAHRIINAAQWNQVYARLSAQDIHDLNALLMVNESTQESPFAVMCRGAGKPTRENLKGLTIHYRWLETLVDPVTLLSPISEAKVTQWANEARRLKARELREYVPPRRYALLLAALRAARGRLLDDLTTMLIKFSAKIVWRSEQHLEDTRIERGDQSATLIATLAEMLKVIAGKCRPTDKLAKLEAIVAGNGGCEVLQRLARSTPITVPTAGSPLRTKRFHRTERSCCCWRARCILRRLDPRRKTCSRPSAVSRRNP